MFNNASDTTICLPAKTVEPRPASDCYVFTAALEDLVEYEPSTDLSTVEEVTESVEPSPASESHVFNAALAELVEFERSADPVTVEQVEQVTEVETVTEKLEPVRVRPRVWTVFLTLLLATGAFVAGQVVLVILLAIGLAVSGVERQNLQASLVEILSHPAGFIFLGLAGQLVIGLAAVVPAMLSRIPFRQRLGLVRAKLPTWGFPVVTLGSLFPAALGILAASWLAEQIPVEDNPIATLMENMTPAWAVLWVLFISLAPGLMEELLFRGYLQTRLLKRWNPCFAILVSSALFGLAHVTPHRIAFAFIVGLYLGVLAWRTGSIWPGVLCHAFINGSGQILHLGQKFGVWSESTTEVAAYTMLGLGVICFGVSVWLMVKARSESIRRESRAVESGPKMSPRLVQA